MIDVRTLGALATGALAVAAQSAGAQTMVAEWESFDPARALFFDEGNFDPFHPESTTLLADALDDRGVREDTGVLVMEVAGTKLALVTRQMAYHHVAQGELAGEPWLVTF